MTGRIGVSLAGLMMGMLFGAASPLTAADYTEAFTGLAGGEVVYGVDASAAPSPFVNGDNYSIVAAGDDTGIYSDVSFEVFGFFSGNEVDIQNTGAVSLTATGGIAHGAEAFAHTSATALAAAGNVDNSGALTVSAQGGTANAGEGSSVVADAETIAIGIESGGTVVNSGTIIVTSAGGSVATDALATVADEGADGASITSSYALGIGADGSVENSGAITVTATGGNATAAAALTGNPDVPGVYGYSGATAMAQAAAYGIGTGGDLINQGAVTVTATGGSAEANASAGGTSEVGVFASARSDARAYGIEANGAVDNSGMIAVTATGGSAVAEESASADVVTMGSVAIATARARGIIAGAGLTNGGAMVVKAAGGSAVASSEAMASARAEGISGEGAVSNRAALSVEAIGGSADADERAAAYAQAYGIRGLDPIDNSGLLNVRARGGTATAAGESDAYAEALGIEAYGDLNNSGHIFVTAVGGTATGADANAGAWAAGIFGWGDLVNSGHIMVTALGGSAEGEDATADAAAMGICSLDGGSVDNSGNMMIFARAPEGSESYAYGIYFENGGNLTHTGSIWTDADTAYEVYVNAGTVTLVDSYNLTLVGDPTVGALYVGEGAELALNDAQLSLTALGSLTQLNTEYRIFDVSDGGTVTGAFGGLASLINPDIVALYHDQSTGNSADDTVSLAYRPGASPQLEGVGLLRHAVNLSADLIGQRLTTGFLQPRLAAHAPRHYAAAQAVVSDAGAQPGRARAGGFFFTPYYANIDKDASPAGYDADLVGFVTGIERETGGDLYGFHLGFGHAGIDYTGTGYSDNHEDQELLSAGVHLMGGRDGWTWRGQLTGFYGWHDYNGLTGASLELHEEADYDSYGVRTALLGGRLFERNGQILLPEVGVEYLWLHRDGFTTDVGFRDNWEVHSDSLDEHQVSALASLRWLTVLQSGEVEVTPSLAAGVRYLVTDDELDVSQSVGGSGPVTVKSDQDDVTGTLSASVRFRKEQLATELAYGGEFGDDTTMHSAWIRFSYLF